MIYGHHFYSNVGYGWIRLEKLVPGNYTIIARVEWDLIEVKDYTISINSADSIAIRNIVGGKESASLKATEDIRSSLIKDLKKAVKISDVSKEETWTEMT
jgi:hypothetical protein